MQNASPFWHIIPLRIKMLNWIKMKNKKWTRDDLFLPITPYLDSSKHKIVNSNYSLFFKLYFKNLWLKNRLKTNILPWESFKTDYMEFEKSANNLIPSYADSEPGFYPRIFLKHILITNLYKLIISLTNTRISLYKTYWFFKCKRKSEFIDWSLTVVYAVKCSFV